MSTRRKNCLARFSCRRPNIGVAELTAVEPRYGSIESGTDAGQGNELEICPDPSHGPPNRLLGDCVSVEITRRQGAKSGAYPRATLVGGRVACGVSLHPSHWRLLLLVRRLPIELHLQECASVFVDSILDLQCQRLALVQGQFFTSSTARATAAPMRFTPILGTPKDTIVSVSVSRARRRL